MAAREAGQAQALAEVQEKAKLTAQRVLDEIALHSFSNVQDLFDEAGNLKPIHTLTREQAACISSLEVIKKNAQAGDGQTDIVHKVKVVEKTKSLEMLAKHFALLTDVVRVQDGDAILERLSRGKKRIAADQG
ncbi:MAG TPA: terminase small subunit [Bryobacteraceae bacterium]|nr:terminase small subunit [Bryobacteraceae bacterium]